MWFVSVFLLNIFSLGKSNQNQTGLNKTNATKATLINQSINQTPKDKLVDTLHLTTFISYDIRPYLVLITCLICGHTRDLNGSSYECKALILLLKVPIWTVVCLLRGWEKSINHYFCYIPKADKAVIPPYNGSTNM
jgi:hypothetical protein